MLQIDPKARRATAARITPQIALIFLRRQAATPLPLSGFLGGPFSSFLDFFPLIRRRWRYTALR
jgi:hypothetical protein